MGHLAQSPFAHSEYPIEYDFSVTETGQLVLLTPALSFFATLALLILLTGSRLAKFALDQPNHRSLHSKPIPRMGGLALMVGVCIQMVSEWNDFSMIAICTGILVGISLFDDFVGLPVIWRLLAHAAVAVAFLDFAFGNGVGVATLAVLSLAMIWMINLYNFMDGSDGLAGGMALIGFGWYGVAAYGYGDIMLCLMCTSIAMSALAFLLFNFNPARIFMGDVGSIPLGFLVASLGIIGWQRECWPVWFPMLVFSPFIVDASATLLKRLLRREKVWQAHREHYYQRLVQMGLGHRNTALAEYVLMFGVGASAIWMLNQSSMIQTVVTLLWVGIFMALMWIVDKQWTAFLGER